MMLPWILLALLVVYAPQDEASHDLPAWTSAPAEDNLFVVKTERFSDHGDAVMNLLPTVKTAVLEWAGRNVAVDCRPLIESMPMDEFRQFVHKDQEIVHGEREAYDAEKARRMEKEFDEYFRGYVRVQIDGSFFESHAQELHLVRMRSRLCSTLLGTLFVLGSLGILWCWFFMRFKSRGLYIKRIRWIIGGLVALLLLTCYVVYRLLF